jgi:hypothetical protein
VRDKVEKTATAGLKNLQRPACKARASAGARVVGLGMRIA